ncbi:hypothetical protein HQ447_04620 [bacterium]|nr:hypothetical protein [bacterium]
MQDLTRLIFLSCTPFFFGEAANAAAIQWTLQEGGNGHWYEVFDLTTGIAWGDAKTLAAGRGGNLASVTSAAEDAFIFNRLDLPGHYNGGQGPWIGGELVSGAWTWVDGESWSYSNWAAGSLAGNGEKCAQYWITEMGVPTLVWNDHLGEIGGVSGDMVSTAYVVEYVPESSTGLLAMLGVASVLIGRTRGSV